MVKKKNFQEERVLTIGEVAEILRVHRSTVSRYAQSGELKSHLLGARRLFKESDVWVFFENLAVRQYVPVKER
jgi:excisionase family DNA binding protein